jgi:leucyl-tRNA---protein transferase
MDDNVIFWEDPLFDTVNIAEAFNSDYMSDIEWENMLATGWRHNAMMFFRVSSQLDENDNKLDILPLRYQLNQFEMSKSQRKVWRKNQDLTFKLTPLSIRDEIHFMFEQHIQRFKYNVPHSIFDFVSHVPNKPFPTYQFEVYKLDKLIGCTFVDITPNTLSSTYAMFDLEESKRSLGIFTMLLEMVYALTYKKQFHYPGYAFLQPSYMDYKKQFAGAEYFDWLTGNWFKL